MRRLCRFRVEIWVQLCHRWNMSVDVASIGLFVVLRSIVAESVELEVYYI